MLHSFVSSPDYSAEEEGNFPKLFTLNRDGNIGKILMIGSINVDVNDKRAGLVIDRPGNCVSSAGTSAGECD